MIAWASGHGYEPAAVTTFLETSTNSIVVPEPNGYQPATVKTFLEAADYWLVAHALAHQGIIVTHEAPADITSKIKIPDGRIPR